MPEERRSDDGGTAIAIATSATPISAILAAVANVGGAAIVSAAFLYQLTVSAPRDAERFQDARDKDRAHFDALLEKLRDRDEERIRRDEERVKTQWLRQSEIKQALVDLKVEIAGLRKDMTK